MNRWLIRRFGWRSVLDAFSEEIESWLQERALRLPLSKRLELQRRFRVSEETILAIEEAIRQVVLESFRRLISSR